MGIFTPLKLALAITLCTQVIRALEISNFEIIEEAQLLENFTDLFPKQNVLSRCGEALTTEHGSIYFKPFDPILPNERCTWVIGVTGAVGYTINIQHLGFPADETNTAQGLILTGVKLGPVMTTYKPQRIGLLNVTNANILVVTFYSTSVTDPLSKGFALQYEAIRTGSLGKTSNESLHHVFESSTFDFKHPATATSYANNELSSFVFPPNDNLYSGGNSNVYYKKGGLESSCYDALYIYTLNVENLSRGIWESKGRICSADATAQISSNEIILILFQSDTSEVSTGFSLTYTAC